LGQKGDPTADGSTSGARRMPPARRRERRGADRRSVDDRAREIERIQTLGRRIAAASTPHELFSTVVATLHEAAEIDAAVVASAIDGPVEVTAYLARPIEGACLDDLGRRAAALLGGAANPPSVVELDEYDPDAPCRRDVAEPDLALVPIERGGRKIAVWILVATAEARDPGMRVLYAAANQATVHLERILAARDAERLRFAAILESMPQAVVVLDARERPTRSNRAARDLFARLGLSLDGDLVSALVALGLGDRIDAVRTGRRPGASAELDLPGDVTLTVTVSPLADADADGAGGVVLVLADVSDSRRLQQRLAQSEKMSSLGQLISGTAHELNNPLACVLGYAQLLAASPVAADPEVARRLGVLRRDAERCQRIVQNLLAFARQRPPARRPISIHQVVESTIALVEYPLRADGVTLRATLDANVPAIDGDFHALQQALLNLVTNAKDALLGAGERGEILIRSAVDGPEVVLDVEDTGPGIPPEIRARVFEPFFTTKAEGHGTGLGLAIVYGAVTSHGGTVEALARAPRGTTIRIRLPASARLDSSDRSGLEAAAPAGRGRVLVVDDEPSVARLLRDALEAEGHMVQCVEDGPAALALVLEDRFDAVVADLKMPGMSGVELFEEIRRERPDLAAGVVLASGDTVSGDAERAAAEAGVELLEKPFDLDRLRASVQRRVALRRG